MNEKIWLTPAEVAPMLGLSRMRVYQLLESNIIPNVKVAGTRRIPTEAFKEWRESLNAEALAVASPLASRSGQEGQHDEYGA
jgi:excisionase family DNA binding protein